MRVVWAVVVGASLAFEPHPPRKLRAVGVSGGCRATHREAVGRAGRTRRGGAVVSQEDAASGDPSAVVPRLGELARFTLTAMPIFVAPTLLSLIDTAVVGQVSSLELGAMGPACAVVDSVSGLLVFISVGTTNAVSRAVAEEGASGSRAKARRTCSVALLMSACVGVAVGAVLKVLASPSTFAVATKSAATGAEAARMAEACAEYVGIRAWGMPATTLLMAAQASCLGAKDSLSPARATFFASAVNVVGDAALVLGPPRMGIAGAAWATVACQYAAVWPCARALRRLRLLDVRGLGKRPPTVAEIRAFFAFGAFLVVVLMKQVTYNQAVLLAALLGPAASAAHQVVYSLSRFCFSVGDVTGATAQAYLPPILATRDTHAARRLVLKIMALSLAVAAVVSGLASALPVFASGVFTADPAVAGLMREAATFAGIGLLFHPVVVGLEGCLLARTDVKWLVSNYLITGALSVLAVAALARRGPALTIANLWQYLAAYQFTRFASFVWRALYSAQARPPSSRSTDSPPQADHPR